MKISNKLCVGIDGTQFYDYDGLQPKITPPKHFSRQCTLLHDQIYFSYLWSFRPSSTWVMKNCTQEHVKVVLGVVNLTTKIKTIKIYILDCFKQSTVPRNWATFDPSKLNWITIRHASQNLNRGYKIR